MYDTESVFNVLAADDTDRRVTSRRALALAHTRVEGHLGGFLRQAANAEDFSARFAACQEDFEGYVKTAAEEHGYEHPEYLAKTLHAHYVHEAMVKEAPGKKHMPGVSDKRNRQYEHIKEQLEDSGKDEERAKEEAARTVNKTRRKHHELKHEGGSMMQTPMATPQQTMQDGMMPQVPPPTTPDQLQQMTGTPAQMPQALPAQDLGQQQGMGQGMQPPMTDLGQPGGQPPFLSKRQWTPFLGDKTAAGGWPPIQSEQFPPALDQYSAPAPSEDPQRLRWQAQPGPQEADLGEFGDQLGQGLGMGQPAPHPLSPEYRQQAQQPGPWMVQDPAGEYPLEDPYAEQYGEAPMYDNLEAQPPRRAGFGGGELQQHDPVVQQVQERFQGVHPDQYNSDGVWMPNDQEQQRWGFGEPVGADANGQGYYQGPAVAHGNGVYDATNMLPPLSIDDGAYAPRQGASFNPSDQDETKASDTVPCPECGGNGKTANDSKCPRCKGSGRVADFGPSVIDSSVRTAEDGNTDLGGPEPKIDKRLWTPQTVGDPEPGDKEHPTKRKDILEPMKAVNDHPLSEIGENNTETETLPTATGFDSSGFDSTSKPGPAPHTDTWHGDSGQAKPVTHDVLD